MEVTDYLAINKAKIEINKINVVGGVNGSGKSTLSRVFYSLLKANSTKRRDYALQRIIEDINETIDGLNGEEEDYYPFKLKFSYVDETINKLNHQGNKYYCLPSHLKINDNPKYIIKKYNDLLEICKMHQKIAEIKMIELTNQMDEILDNLIKNLENNGFDVNEINDAFKVKEFVSHYEYYYSKDVSIALQKRDNVFNRFVPLRNFCFEMACYENILDFNLDFESYSFLLSEEMQEYYQDISKIDDFYFQCRDFLDISDNSDFRFPILDLDFKKRMDIFFGEDSPKLSRDSLSEIFATERIFSKEYAIEHVYGTNFELYQDLNDYKMDAFDYFFYNGLISSVYYVDNFSLMDLSEIKKHERFELFHINEILECLELDKKMDFDIDFKSDIFQKRRLYNLKEKFDLSQDVENILRKIKNIIHGSYERYSSLFYSDKKIEDRFSYGSHVFSHKTASGIKQIGIIQLLLRNNKLQKDGYLIIDEPEVNLHPDWQFKFAEILVLLAKDLNITVYLNSHSPFFIEAIDAFTEFYDMQDDINYYLTEESEKEGKYNFTKIESDELYKIYDNLGKPYDLIDQLRLQKHLGE